MAGGCTRKVGLIEATPAEFSRIEREKPANRETGFAHFSIIRTNASRSGIHCRRAPATCRRTIFGTCDARLASCNGAGANVTIEGVARFKRELPGLKVEL
jgi:hypothetical protein